uniref:VOC family protein n=1 Tax=Acinetobacter baumannii TaxID=470 RepID=UPI00148A0CE4
GTGERGRGHVAITSRNPNAMIAFWREIVDAKISDYSEDRISGVNLRITFLRRNTRHHSIAIAGTKGIAMDPFATKIQHIEMQVTNLDDL